LLKTSDPGATLKALMEARDPIYAEADLTVASRETPHAVVVDDIVAGLREFLGCGDQAGAAGETA
jgi:shikimate kinase